MSDTREVERIKCRKCHLNTDKFEVNKTWICGEDFGCEIHESPYCPRCGSHHVLEILSDGEQ